MKLRIAVIACGLLAAAAFVRPGTLTVADQSGPETRAPWQAGTCYRAYLDDERPPHVVKVLETGDAPWIRVEPQPAGPRIPGARERDPLWINTSELFAAQEAPCPTATGR